MAYLQSCYWRLSYSPTIIDQNPQNVHEKNPSTKNANGDPMNPSLISAVVSAAESSPHRYRVGAIVASKKTRYIAINNMRKTHPIYTTNEKDRKIHAEFGAIKAAGASSKRATLIVARVLRNGNLAIAKPCKICESLARTAGIRRIIFSTANGFEEMRIS